MPRAFPVLAAAVLAPLQASAQVGGWADSRPARVYERCRDAVVRVESAGSVAAGFLYRSQNEIATAFHAIARARPVVVRRGSGERYEANVIAVDRDRDLAILRLNRDIGGVAPLEAGATPRVGDAVLAIGHPLALLGGSPLTRGLLGWSATGGIVSAVGPDALQTDAAVNPGNSGGPVLDVEGRVVGVMVRKIGEGVGVAARVEHLASLDRGIGRQPRFRGVFETTTALGYRFEISQGDAWHGLFAEIGVLALDRFAASLRLGFAWGSWNSAQIGVLDRSGSLASVDLDLWYRVFIGAPGLPLFLSLGAGVSAEAEGLEQRRVVVVPRAPSCDPSVMACSPQAVIDRELSNLSWWGPMAGVGLDVGPMRFVYTVHADASRIEEIRHRLLLGLAVY